MAVLSLSIAWNSVFTLHAQNRSLGASCLLLLMRRQCLSGTRTIGPQAVRHKWLNEAGSGCYECWSSPSDWRTDCWYLSWIVRVYIARILPGVALEDRIPSNNFHSFLDIVSYNIVCRFWSFIAHQRIDYFWFRNFFVLAYKRTGTLFHSGFVFFDTLQIGYAVIFIF